MMIIANKNEVRDVIDTSKSDKFRFNRPEAICYKGFETVKIDIF
jgi:hypothetical protein